MASLVGGELSFGNSPDTQNIAAIVKATRRLEKELSKEVGRPLRVRSVVAVPGWEVERQQDPDHLLVSERTLPMIRGWKDAADHLMDEEVDFLQGYLTQRCKRSKRRA